MNLFIPKADRKAALISFLALLALTAIICAMELSTHRLHVREYLVEVGLGATFGALGGVVFGYIGWLSMTAVRYLIGTVFYRGQIVRALATPANLDGMRAKLEAAGR